MIGIGDEASRVVKRLDGPPGLVLTLSKETYESVLPRLNLMLGNREAVGLADPSSSESIRLVNLVMKTVRKGGLRLLLLLPPATHEGGLRNISLFNTALLAERYASEAALVSIEYSGEPPRGRGWDGCVQAVLEDLLGKLGTAGGPRLLGEKGVYRMVVRGGGAPRGETPGHPSQPTPTYHITRAELGAVLRGDPLAALGLDSIDPDLSWPFRLDGLDFLPRL